MSHRLTRRKALKDFAYVATVGLFLPSRILRGQDVIPVRRKVAAAGGGGGAGGPFTFVKSTGVTDDASDTTTTAQLLTVTAGNLIALWVKHEGTAVTITASDGTTSFTARTKTSHTNNDLHGQWFYLLSSVASGTVTYTATFSTARAFKRMIVFEFDPTGSAAYDTEALSATNANGTSLTSGNLTTTANDSLVLGGYGDYSAANLTAMQINGVNAANIRGADDSTGTTQDISAAWSRTPTATFTGAATATLASANDYVLNAIAFK